MISTLSFVFLYFISFNQSYANSAATPVLISSDLNQNESDARSLNSDELKSTTFNEEKLSSTKNTKLGEFLSEQPGLDYRLNATGLSGFSIRGSRAEHVLVMIDGVRMNDPSDPSRNFDFSKINLTQIEKIEILKGSGSVAYGADALGGVVLITTKKKSGISALLEGGNYEFFKTNLSTRTALHENLSTTLNMGSENTKGPSAAKVKNGDLDGVKNLNGKIGLHFNSNDKTLKAEIGASIHSKKEDLDAGNDADNNAYTAKSLQKTTEIRLRKNWNDSHTSNFQASHLTINRNYNDEHGTNLFFDPTHETYRGSSTQILLSHKHLTEFYNLPFEFFMGSEGNFESLSVDSTLSGSSGISLKKTHHLATFLQTKIALSKEDALTLGVRETRFEHRKNFASLRGSYNHTLTKNTLLDFTIGTGYKPPTLFQLYSPSSGNLNLKNEKSTTMSFTLKSSRYEISLFQNRFYNLITAESSPPYLSKNINRGNIKGGELSLNFNLTPLFTFSPHYTYLNTLNPDKKSKLPGRPTHKGGVNLRTNLTESTQITTEWILKSNRYEGFGRDSAGFGLLHLSGETKFFIPLFSQTNELTLFFRLENALNKDYMEINGYSSPERSLYLGVRGEI